MSFCIEMLGRAFREHGMPLGVVIGATVGAFASIWATTGEPPIISGSHEISPGQGAFVMFSMLAGAYAGARLGANAQFNREPHSNGPR